jgi:hypothetical protein
VEVGGEGTLVVLTRGGFLKRGGKRNGLVGAGVAGRKGGDACVAHGGEGPRDAGDASVPSPRTHHPRPYGYGVASGATSYNTYP